jgi:transcription initiation factor TFIIB
MIEKSSKQREKCQVCGKRDLITDSDSGEVFCGACGRVYSERIQDSGPEWRSFADDGTTKGRTGAKTSLSQHDMGLSTVINPSNKDATGKVLSPSMKMTVKRLRVWDSRSQNKPVDRNLKDAFNELHKMKDKLALSDAIIEKASYIYRKALEKKLVRGRSISAMIAASLYAACRDAETPRTLKDVSDKSNVKKKIIAACYRTIVKEFDLKMPVVDSVQCIARIASQIDLPEKTKRDAVKIIRGVEKIKLSAGKNPMGFAATALYLSCVQNNDRVTQKDIAAAANITEVTLRNRLKGFKTVAS